MGSSMLLLPFYGRGTAGFVGGFSTNPWELKQGDSKSQELSSARTEKSRLWGSYCRAVGESCGPAPHSDALPEDLAVETRMEVAVVLG